jgi:hypothetical protein
MRSPKLSSLFLSLAFFLALAARSGKADVAYVTFPSDVDWVTRDSDHFFALYRKGQERLAIRSLMAAERAYRLLTPIFPPGPEKTWLVLADFQDSTNGYSLDLPYPHIVIFVSPPEPSGQLAALDEWLDSVILHEYVHTLHIYPASGLWKVARTIFGSWVLPNGLMPSHFHEGLAVELETQKSAGGRGRGAAFSMYRRMAVDAKVWGTERFFSRDQMDGGVLRWPHGTSAYLFGYQLMHELHQRKGDKGIYDFTDSFSSNWPFFVGLPLDEVYQTNYPTLWKEIFKKTETEAQAEIDWIKREPLTNLRPLTNDKDAKWDLTVSPDGQRAAYRRWTPKDGSAIDVIGVKEGKLLQSIDTTPNSAEGMCWGQYQGKDALYFLEPSASNGYSLNGIRVWDFADERKSSLKSNKEPLNHLHALSCDPKLERLLVYQEVAGKGRVLELSVSGAPKDRTAKIEREWAIPEGDWVTSLLTGPTDDWITLRDGLKTAFFRWPRKEATPRKVSQMQAHLYGLKNVGNELYAIADVEGRGEIWSVDPERRTMKKRVALLGGADSFSPTSKNSLLLANYTHGGYDIVEAPTAVLKSQSFPEGVDKKSSTAADEKVAITEERSYSALRTLFPRAWIPNLLLVPDGVQFGVWIPGFDVSQRHVYNLFGGYDWRGSQGSPFGDLNYMYRFGKNYSLTTDLFYSPSYFISLKSFLKQYGGSVGISTQFDWLPPTVGLSLLYRKMEPILSNPENHSVGVQLSLGYNFGFKRRPISISSIQGTAITASHAQFLKGMGSKDNYFTSFLGVDQYLEAPWAREHVWFLSSKFGYTEGTNFLNSYYTAGGEVVFSQARGTFLNRGFQPQTFFGRRIANFNLEYRFPLARIERGWNYFPLKLRVLHGALVGDATTVDNGPVSTVPISLFKHWYASAGAEIKSDWTFGSYLPAQLRLGGYHGFGKYGEAFYFVMGLEASL